MCFFGSQGANELGSPPEILVGKVAKAQASAGLGATDQPAPRYISATKGLASRRKSCSRAVFFLRPGKLETRLTGSLYRRADSGNVHPSRLSTSWLLQGFSIHTKSNA
jgi:hypothetical protein